MAFTFPKPMTWAYMPLFEKIAYYKTILNESYSPFVDKLEAKRIVKEMCGDDIKVADVKRILDDPDDFSEADIDTHSMIKASHGCGWNISMAADTNVADVKALLHSWNHTYSASNEAQYKYIAPRFFIEEKVNDKEIGITNVAITYMITCVRGSPITFIVRKQSEQSCYDMNKRVLGIRATQPVTPFLLPAEFDTMIQLAKKLSKPFEFVRIDLYIGHDGIYLSEFTFTPRSGFMLYSMQKEKEFGKLWK